MFFKSEHYLNILIKIFLLNMLSVIVSIMISCRFYVRYMSM